MRPLMARPSPPLVLALAGLMALAAAMGIGRFLLTPALPMMAAGTGLGPLAGGLIASANYLGYLAGALGAALMIGGGRSMLVGALGMSVLTTAAMGLTADPFAWAALRFAGGVASALVLVVASSLILARLRSAGRGDLSAVHFAGVGVGIVISALVAAPVFLNADGWRPLWLAGGVVSAAALAVVAAALPAEAPRAAAADGVRGTGEPGLWRLVLGYGCLGFGYVITATFIVTIVREGGGARVAETWVWLAVGLAAIPSVAFWGWLGRRFGAPRAFALAMAVEAAGVALAAVVEGALALALSAVALGGTFMGLTALGLQEAGRRAGGDGRRAMGLMTASFGTGQMIGPALAGWLREATGGYGAPSLIAAAVLVAGGLVVLPLAHPAKLTD